MIFEYQSAWHWLDELDGYLDAMDAEGWQLSQLHPTPLGTQGPMQSDYELYVFTLHRRAIEPDREAEHIDQVRRSKAA